MNLRSYIETARTERRKVTDERHAFSWFYKRVQALSATTAEKRRSPRTLRKIEPIVSTSTPDSGLEAVERAYEETVMNVPHYEVEYGDTPRESIATEFGEEVAVAITQSTQLQPPIRQGILDAVEQARNERKRFATVLDREISALADAYAAVDQISADLRRLNDRPLAEHSSGELSAVREKLDTLKRECDELAADRQAELRRQQRSLSLPSERPDIATYLYEEDERTYPILATVAELGSLIEETRARVDRALISA